MTSEEEDLDYRARKCIVHSLRFLHLGLQMIENREMYDLTVTTWLTKEIFDEV
jgi:hypothetical protein